MPLPLIYGAVALAGLYGTGWALNKADGAMDSAARLTKWAVAGGCLYVAYKAAQEAGAIK